MMILSSAVMRRASAVALLCAMSLWGAWSEAAQTPLASVAMEIAEAQPRFEGLSTLKARGASLGSLLVMESLPKGGFMAEVSVQYKGAQLRLPVKLAAQATAGCKRWEVVWAPSKDYVIALLNMSTSGALPKPFDGSPQWVKLERLPALPLILTRQRIISPFGEVSLESDAAQDISERANELAPPKALLVHTQRWLREVLEDDQGPASVDFLVDQQLSWLQLQRVLLGVSSLGLFRVYVITGQDGELGALPLAAPVFGSNGAAKPLIVGYYQLAAGQVGIRISSGQHVLKDDAPCDPEMSFCVAGPQALGGRLVDLGKKLRAKDAALVKDVMFAAPGEVSVGSAISFLSVLPRALGSSPQRLFLGYIRR